jgi:hypothetical protein
MFVRIADDPADARKSCNFTRGALRVAAGNDNLAARVREMNSPNRGPGGRIRRIGDGARIQNYQFGLLRRLGRSQAIDSELEFDGSAVSLTGAASEVLNVKTCHKFILAHREPEARVRRGKAAGGASPSAGPGGESRRETGEIEAMKRFNRHGAYPASRKIRHDVQAREHSTGKAGGREAKYPDCIVPQHRRPTLTNVPGSGRSAKLHAEATCRFCWKHSRQNTGRPCVGRNGTVVSFEHCEHTVRVSTLGAPCPDCGPAPRTEIRLVLQVLQRLGSFLNCLSWKNNCSPAVKTKSAPQSMHFKTLSWNSIETYSLRRSSLARRTLERATHSRPVSA